MEEHRDRLTINLHTYYLIIYIYIYIYIYVCVCVCVCVCFEACRLLRLQSNYVSYFCKPWRVEIFDNIEVLNIFWIHIYIYIYIYIYIQQFLKRFIFFLSTLTLTLSLLYDQLTRIIQAHRDSFNTCLA